MVYKINDREEGIGGIRVSPQGVNLGTQPDRQRDVVYGAVQRLKVVVTNSSSAARICRLIICPLQFAPNVEACGQVFDLNAAYFGAVRVLPGSGPMGRARDNEDRVITWDRVYGIPATFGNPRNPTQTHGRLLEEVVLPGGATVTRNYVFMHAGGCATPFGLLVQFLGTRAQAQLLDCPSPVG